MSNSAIKTFSIFLANGQKKPGLKKSFLETVELEQDQKEVVLSDGSVWPLFKEEELQNLLNKTGQCKAIVSFQVFSDGEYFAIGRVFHEKH